MEKYSGDQQSITGNGMLDPAQPRHACNSWRRQGLLSSEDSCFPQTEGVVALRQIRIRLSVPLLGYSLSIYCYSSGGLRRGDCEAK